MVFGGLRFIPFVVVVPFTLHPHRVYQSAELRVPRPGIGGSLTYRTYAEEKEQSKTDEYIQKAPQRRPDFWYQGHEVVIRLNEASLFFADSTIIVEEPVFHIFDFMARSTWIRP